MTEKKWIDNIEIEDAVIRFRNFSGAKGDYNRQGDRNFCVLLTDEKILDQALRDGWNVKYLPPRDDLPEVPYMQIKVKYGKISPRIAMITAGGRRATILNEKTVGSLDTADIEKVDLIIRPYNYEVDGRSGISAYVKNMYVTIREDIFEAKYRDVMDSAQESLGEPYLEDE